MMKTTLTLRKGNKLEWASFFFIISAVVFAVCEDLRILPFVVLNLFYLYQKGFLVYTLHTLLLVVLTALINPLYAMIYAGLSIAFFLNVHLHELLKLNLKKELIFWNTSFVIVAYYLIMGIQSTMFELALITFGIHYYFTYLQEEEDAKKVFLFSTLSVLYLILLPIFPTFNMHISLSYLVLCAYLLPLNLCLMVFAYFSLLEIPFFYLLFLIMINYNRKYRVFLSLLAWFSLGIDFTLYNILFASLCSVMGLFSCQGNDVFMETTEDLEKGHRLYMEHSFYRQLVNYSNVFYDLSSYYEDKNKEESEMLKLMGDALDYNAKMSKKYFYTGQQMNIRIKELLNGYKFSLGECEYEELDGRVRISMDVAHLYKGELEEVIIPLIEKLTQNKLRIASNKVYPFQREKHQLVLESLDYFPITTYGNSLHMREVSGDSYHTFHLDQFVVMMLSDGMGQGENAKKTSALLIQIMEAMMRCNIPQVECIKMINLFLRSDIYATLDILTLNRRSNKAYLYKSASAPTYLLRKEELYSMGAHSLPIGIVDNIQADVFEIPFEKGDVFIMTSDGIMKEEIEKWQSLKRCNAIKNEGLNLVNILKEKKRGDDSTVLMAKID